MSTTELNVLDSAPKRDTMRNAGEQGRIHMRNIDEELPEVSSPDKSGAVKTEPERQQWSNKAEVPPSPPLIAVTEHLSSSFWCWLDMLSGSVTCGGFLTWCRFS